MLASRCYITSASQHTSVINSHHLHYSRLWNNVHQVSSLTLCAVLTWADMWHRKSSQIPCHRKSLSSPPCLCLRLPLTVSLTSQPLPTPFHFSPSSLSDFSIFLFWNFFQSVLFFALLLLLLSCRSTLFSDIHREEARRICEKSVCRWWTAKLWLLCLLYELEKSANRSPASAAIRLILYWYACRSWVWTISRAKISPLSPSSNSSSIVQQVGPDFISEM